MIVSVLLCVYNKGIIDVKAAVCSDELCFPPQEDPGCSERLSGSVWRYTERRERCAGAPGLSAEAVPLCVHKNRNASRGLWTTAKGAGLMFLNHSRARYIH